MTDLNQIPLTPLPRKVQQYLKKNSTFELSRILVGVTGGSAAGKTTLCETIKREMQYDSEFDMTILSLDSFYKGIDKSKVDIASYNFDHPDSLDWDLAYQVVTTLLQGHPAQVPVYCFVTHKRLEKQQIVMPSQVIVFEGILALYDERIRQCMQYKIFMHCDDDIRLCRRIIRDVNERGRSVEGVLYQYNRFVKKSFSDYIYPTMSLADIIIPGSRDNQVSVTFIVNHLKNLTKQLGLLKEKMMTVLYFGDLLYSVDGFMKKKYQYTAESILVLEQRPTKQLLFPAEETIKMEFSYHVQNLTSHKILSQKQLYKILKTCHKLALQIIEKTLIQKKIPFNSLQVLNLENIYNNGTLLLPNLNDGCQYLVITIPFLFKDGYQLLSTMSQFLKHNHSQVLQFQIKIKMIVVNLFSDIKTVSDIYGQFRNLKFLVNAFLVGRMDKFIQCLQLKDQPEEPPIFYEQTKLHQKLGRYLSKRTPLKD